MLTGQTRLLLLRAGRCSIELWLRAARLSESGLGSDARAAYDRMADTAPWPDQQVNRAYLVFIILPWAALYTVLRERGRTEPEAVETVMRAARAAGALERTATGLLLRTAPGRRLFMRGGPRVVGGLFPAPAWEYTWVQRSDSRVAFDVTRCYALDTLRLLDVAPVAVAVCAYDAYVYAQPCPHLRFSRAGTLAMGAARCDFCWELVQPERTHVPARPAASETR